MSRLIFSSLAEQDLLQIIEYLANDRSGVARKWYENLREKCQLLASNPELGELRPDLQEQVRSFVVKRWVIYYHMQDKVVVIDRVLDGSRDVKLIDKWRS